MDATGAIPWDLCQEPIALCESRMKAKQSFLRFSTLGMLQLRDAKNAGSINCIISNTNYPQINI